MTYWCVSSEFYDDGKVVVSVYEVTSRDKLEDYSHSYRNFDLYVDFFASEDEAREFAAQAKNA